MSLYAVWKFPFKGPDDFPVITMPLGAQPLHFGVQEGIPTLWALIDPEAPIVRHAFRFAGTGHPIETGRNPVYIGSCFHGPLVWHLFDLGESPADVASSQKDRKATDG